MVAGQNACAARLGSHHRLAGIIVAIVDTGIDPSQPDLRGNLVPGYDYVNGDPDPSDDNGHGTAVAGIVGEIRTMTSV